MKLTKKSTKTEVETTETVCEITQDEFERLCASTAATTIVQIIGDDLEVEDFMMGVALTKMFADFASNLTKELFNDTNENPDKNEKEEN
jgi:hypothetical protein